MAKKWITLVEACDAQKQEITEGSVSIKKIIAREESKAKQKQRQEVEDRMKSTRRRALDLDTNDEISMPNVIHDDTPKSVSAVDNRKHASVVWNPTRDQQLTPAKAVPRVASAIKDVSNVIDSENPAPVDASENDPKRQSVVVQGTNEEIQFIDNEEKKQRVASHPKLRNKSLPETNDPLIDDPDETRRKKHPKLSQRNQNDEIDFVNI